MGLLKSRYNTLFSEMVISSSAVAAKITPMMMTIPMKKRTTMVMKVPSMEASMVLRKFMIQGVFTKVVFFDHEVMR